jgi:para-nitrobenzyl esterase
MARLRQAPFLARFVQLWQGTRGDKGGETMRHSLVAVALTAGFLAAGAALADPPPPTPAAAPAAATASAAPMGLALMVFPARSGKTLHVTSPAFADGADIPFKNTQYEGNVFPGLHWGHGPYGTRSFVIIMQDADVNYHGGPLLHWSMYDIPAGATHLDPGLIAPPVGASFGPNVRGPSNPYMGPHTPRGPKHHYHFAVLALDVVVPADPKLTYDALAAAIQGHVLASGDVIGLGQFDPNVAPPPVPPEPPPAAH